MFKAKRLFNTAFSLCVLIFSASACEPTMPEIPENLIHDNESYINYEPLYHLERENETVELDIEKELFPDGKLSDTKNQTFELREKYDRVYIPETKYLDVKVTAPFSISISKKRTTNDAFSEGIYFHLVNSKTREYSNKMFLGYFGLKKFANRIWAVSKPSDFKALTKGTLAYLVADIDFTDYDFDKEGYLCPDFSGIFLNPDGHVFKNLHYETEAPKYQSMFSAKSDNCWYDSLQFDNVSYTNGKQENSETSSSNFAVFASSSNRTIYRNIKAVNVNVDGPEQNLSFFTNRCYDSHFVGCEIAGIINSRYKVDPMGEVAKKRSSVTALANYPTVLSMNDYNIGMFMITDKTPKDKIQENLRFYKKTIEEYASVYVDVRNNVIKMRLTSNDTVGGLFGHLPIDPPVFRGNRFDGHLYGKRTGKLFGCYTFLEEYSGDISQFE